MGAGAGDPTSENQIRGQSFRSVLDACDEVIGPGARNRVIASLSKDLREACLYGAIVSGGWYSIDWYLELIRAIRLDAPTIANVGRRIAHVSAREDAKGVYKFILRLTTPSFVLTHLGRVMGTFIRHSDFDIIERQPGLVRGQVLIPGANSDMWEDFAGAAEAILTIAGAQNIEVQVRSKTQMSSAIVTAKWTGENG